MTQKTANRGRWPTILVDSKKERCAIGIDKTRDTYTVDFHTFKGVTTETTTKQANMLSAIIKFIKEYYHES